tara:strand:+ start:1128 stop:1385 length:258 start_codon:yes stop_codon:yes gene_type:complete
LNELEKKILWQCRRGLWELDAILIPFVENNFVDLSENEVEELKELLKYEDIEIFDILVNKKSFENLGLDTIIKKIIDFQETQLDI